MRRRFLAIVVSLVVGVTTLVGCNSEPPECAPVEAVIGKRHVELHWCQATPLLHYQGIRLIQLTLHWQDGKFWGYMGRPFSEANLRGLCGGSGDIVVNLGTDSDMTFGDVREAISKLAEILSSCDPQRKLVIYIIADVVPSPATRPVNLVAQ